MKHPKISTVIQDEEVAERTNLLIERLRCGEKQRFVFKLGTGHRSSTSRQPLYVSSKKILKGSVASERSDLLHQVFGCGRDLDVIR